MMRWRMGQAPEPAAGVIAPLPGPAYKSYFVYSAEFLPLAAGTANARPTALPFATVSIRIHSDSNFELVKTMAVATDERVYLRIRDETAGRFLQRGTPMLREWAGIADLLGTAPFQAPRHQPYIWEPPYVIAGSAVLAVDAAEASGADNTIRVSFHGSKVRPGRAPWDRPYRYRLPYILRLPPDDQDPEIAANATLNFAAPIDNEADFLVHRIVGTREGAALITLGDPSDRVWMDRPVHSDNLLGSGGWPNILPSPRFIPRGFAVFGSLQNLTGATNRVRIMLLGEKLYE